MVGLSGFEPLTSRLSGGRSNQLSYRPEAGSLAERNAGDSECEERVTLVYGANDLCYAVQLPGRLTYPLERR